MSGETTDPREHPRFHRGELSLPAPDVELGDGDDFLALGIIDSLGFVELVEEVQSRYGVEIDGVEITEENFGSIDAVVGFRGAQASNDVSAGTLAGDIGAAAAEAPDRLAVVAGERSVSYGELDDLVGRFAAGLIEWG